MDEVEIGDDVIRLGQLVKLAGLAEDGAQAKSLIEGGDVQVDGQVETRRGRQVVPGSVVTVYERSVRVVRTGG